MRLLLLFIFFINSIAIFCQGSTRIGGSMRCECIGEGDLADHKKYKLNFELLSQCTAPTWPTFTITIYKNNTLLVDIIPNFLPLAELDSTIILDPLPYSCYDFTSDNCVKTDYYSVVFDLLLSDESYYVVIHHCCRPPEIQNFLHHPDGTGQIFYSEITPEAQQTCNKSPKLLNPLITELCKGIDFNISYQGMDADGDQLVYQFYSPFDWEHFDGVSWYFPPLPPPYTPIIFNVPNYTTAQPLGIAASLNLNPNTGQLTGNPKENGLFLVGIAIKEYRNGQLLNTTYRDFLIEVSDCSPIVNAQIQADSILDNTGYIINVCNTDTYTLQNTSNQMEFIQDYAWAFEGLNGSFNEWNPTLSFPEGGIYQGQLFLNQNAECPDTANIILNVTTDIDADFGLSYDTCLGGAVAFENQSFSEGGTITNLSWNFGDTNSSNEVAPQHLYQAPGTYTVHLAIENEFGCVDSNAIQFDWLPVPPIIVVAPSTFEGCSPLEVSFENLSSPIDSAYTINWDFGDGRGSSEIHPEHTYPEPQTYSLYVSITSPIGCFTDTIFPNWIQVESPPIADFSFSPDVISSFDPTVMFQDESDRAVAWSWNFDGEENAYTPTPNHTFIDTGFQNVTLLVEDEYGCTDNITQVIDIIPKTTYYLPNAFTPNGDGKNDVFKGRGILDGIKHFQMIIWDRWGGKVFETQNPNEGWHGVHFKTSNNLPIGVYICQVQYTPPRGDAITIIGNISLIR